ncbi:kinesin-like protein KIN-7O [Orussus abietinus]|uniref:kinesin-like protein KIN-7O n=1 Tax=Orussus abietinus TaxID=222816 RepID=UPI000626497E|nr:kinesin-like protein KIN-7O [Orussus abietinus]
MSDSIQVAIKVRPLIKREKEENLKIQWMVQDKTILPIDSDLRRRAEGGFHFDHIFDADSTNIDIFNNVAKPVIEAVVNGFNGTIFAYGQTSSGKTYTMMGTEQEPGILPLAVEHIFHLISNSCEREFLLRVSYLEIYNEKINDLLIKDSIDLKLHEDINGQVYMNCKEEVIQTEKEVLKYMKQGDKNRRIGVTNMNEKSSRSHSIFRIIIESREMNADSNCAIKVSQLNLVDLAGSERARQTGATGERFKEGKHINMSLSALSLVIKQLSDSQEGQKYINFRDSKLTRILQNSLGGNAMTAIICTVTLAAFDETHCTLAFASRAKSVKNQPHLNEVMSDAALLKRIKKQMAILMAELQASKQKSAKVEHMETKLQEKDQMNQILEQRIELLKSRIVSGNSIQNEKDFKTNTKRRRTWGGPDSKVPLPLPSRIPSVGEFFEDESSHEAERMQEIKRRQSIIQSTVTDILKERFQTAFADFELELIESERERNRSSCTSIIFEEVPVQNEIEELEKKVHILNEGKEILQHPLDTVKESCSNINDLQNLIKNLQTENDELKCQLKKQVALMENETSDLRNKIDELEGTMRILEEDKRMLSQQLNSFKESKALVISKSSDFDCSSPLAVKTVCESSLISIEDKSIKNYENTSGIFSNISYFDKMDASDTFTENDIQTSEFLTSDELTKSFDIQFKSEKIEDLTKQIKTLKAVNETILSKVTDDEHLELLNNLNELVICKSTLENKNAKLGEQLRLKIQESEYVKKCIQSLKVDIGKLEKTILLLTSENEDLFSKLTAEKKRADEDELKLQSQIDDLYSRVLKATEEKANLENDLTICKDELETYRAFPPTVTDEEVQKKLEEYERKMAQLTEENIELSSDLMDKIEELDKVKESKALLYGHDCTYKEKVESLLEKMSCLKQENDELLSNLMKTNEECDSLREAHNLLKSKLEVSLTNPRTPKHSKNLVKGLTIENMILKSEATELKTKMAMLSEENDKLSNSLLFINDVETVQQNVSFKDSLHLSVLNDCSSQNSSTKAASENNVDSLTLEIKMLRERNDHITRLNEKLSSLKLSSCTQCKHLKEIMQSRRMLKIENKNLHKKLHNVQRKLDRFDLSQSKIIEDFSVNDSTMNSSSLEVSNVSLVEEKLEALRNQLQALKENDETQSDSPEENCAELEISHQNDANETSLYPKVPEILKGQVRIEKLQETLQKLEQELQEVKKINAVTGEELQKLSMERANMLNEIESLKTYKELDNEKVEMLEGEITNLSSAIERLNVLQNETTREKLNLEVEIEKLKAEREDNKNLIDELRKCISELQENNCVLAREVNETKQDVNAADRQRMSINSGNEEEIANSGKLLQERIELQLKCDRLRNELFEVKEFIVEELRVFHRAVMSKEQEVVETIQERFDMKRKELEDRTHQSQDSEKIVTVWAKKLEVNVERLQIDLLQQEDINSWLCKELDELNRVLRESHQESQYLKEKVEVLKSDLGALQNVHEKQSEKKGPDDETVDKANEKQHLVSGSIGIREKEVETQLKIDKENKLMELTGMLVEAYKSRNVELENNVKTLKALEENLIIIITRSGRELTCNVRRLKNLEVEMEQLKETHNKLFSEIQQKDRYIEETINIFKEKDDKLNELSVELKIATSRNETLKQQLAHSNRVVEDLKRKMGKLEVDSSKRIENITERFVAEERNVAGLRRQMLDLTNVDSALKSELESLKGTCEKLEKENEKLKKEVENRNNKSHEIVEDLQDEKMSLNIELEGANNLIKQLQESKNQSSLNNRELREKYETLCQEKSKLESFKGICEELEKENEKLKRKICNRNSKSQEIVESLQDEVANCNRQLEGANNLIKELQMSRNELTLVNQELQGKYETLCQENDKLAKELETYKTSYSLNSVNLRPKLVQKPQEATDELSETKRVLQLKEEEICKYQNEMEEVRKKNKELDEEMEEMVEHINNLNHEILVLTDKLYSPESGFGPILELERTINSLKFENENLKARFPPDTLSPNSYKKKLEHYKKQNQELLAKIETTKKVMLEASDLRNRVTELENKLKEKEACSSRNVESGEEVFNRKQCHECSVFKDKNRQLELEIVSKNGIIATLEIKIQSENFPYRKKCKNLEEDLLTFQNKNVELKKLVKELQRTIVETSVRDCKGCRIKKINGVNQFTQTMSEYKGFISDTHSGVYKEQLKIERLIKEKELLRDLCRSRCRQIKEHEKRISELEKQQPSKPVHLTDDKRS